MVGIARGRSIWKTRKFVWSPRVMRRKTGISCRSLMTVNKQIKKYNYCCESGRMYSFLPWASIACFKEARISDGSYPSVAANQARDILPELLNRRPREPFARFHPLLQITRVLYVWGSSWFHALDVVYTSFYVRKETFRFRPKTLACFVASRNIVLGSVPMARRIFYGT